MTGNEPSIILSGMPSPIKPTVEPLKPSLPNVESSVNKKEEDREFEALLQEEKILNLEAQIEKNKKEPFKPSNELEVESIKPPAIINPLENSTVIKVSEIKGPLDCIATRKGFYNQERLRSGDKFKMKNFYHLGDWMEFLDPLIEKKRKEFLKDKKHSTDQKKIAEMLKDPELRERLLQMYEDEKAKK